MATKAQGTFKIIAQLDGTTINGSLRVEKTALVQRYTDAGAYIPDFDKLADDKKPAVVPIFSMIGSETLLIPNSLTWYYNGVALTFSSSTNLSTNSGMEGVFKLDKSYSASYGGSSYTVTALRVVKNLVPLSGYDNDRISVSGTVEVSGNSMSFYDVGTTVVIQKSTGSSYTLSITPSGYTFTKGDTTVTLTADLYDASGGLVSSTTGYTYYWREIDVNGDDEALSSPSTTKTQVVKADDIDNYGLIACTVSDGEGTELATGFAPLNDDSDPIVVNVSVTGISGDRIRKGETATITPVAAYRDSGQEIEVQSWTWHLFDQNYSDFMPSGQQSSTFTADSIKLTYEDVNTNAKGGVLGYVSTTI